MAAQQRSIIFFGDGSHETQTSLSQILRTAKEGTLLWQFLKGVSKALLEECARLPPDAREELPKFHDLNNLLKKHGEDKRPHPALHPTELLLSQLGQFIGSYERFPTEAYPSPNEDIIIGLCFGELSATAISLARNLLELLPLAVEAVRQAFRGGVLTWTTARELEPQQGLDESWSLAVPRDSGLADGERIEQLCIELEIPKRKHAYTTALSAKTIVIGGPPSTLNRIVNKLSSDKNFSFKGCPHRVHVYAPYHSPLLYTENQIERMTDGALQRNLWADIPDQQRTLIGAFTGRHYKAPNRQELVERVYHDILSEPMIWDNVVEGTKECVAQSGIKKWVVRTFGPTLAVQSMISTLRTDLKVDISIDESFDVGRILDANPKRIPLAIVGMAGRFPEAVNHDELWTVLEQGLDCHKIVPSHRFDPDKHLSKPTYGCFMDAPGNFDARFFNMSPREALQTDPGQRLGLVTAYEAMEMAGYVPNRTPATTIDRIGTFYGQAFDEYREQNLVQEVGTYFVSGAVRAFGPGRINHYFKFGGPAYSVDTACSSSLVALNLACNSVWSGECDTALAGGMNIVCCAHPFQGLSEGHFLSETGNCKTYDNGADGYCRGEGVGSVVVKRLDAAQADNDNILATILSTASNYPDNAVSITHPYGPTQERLFQHVLNQAGIDPFDVGYIEMHGTGTQAGDATEMSSVTNVFAPDSPRRPRDQPLWVGAVKANIGHSEAASGVTALIKTLLVLREQRIPPQVFNGELNKTFPDLDERNVHIPFKGAEFPAPPQRLSTKDGPALRHALVNNFSAAGGNTAMLLAESRMKERAAAGDKRTEHVICISAKTKTALDGNMKNLIQYLDQHPETSLSDLSYTTTARRIQYPIRVSILAKSVKQLREKLETESHVQGRKAADKCSGTPFAFTGQGALYTSLGKDLYDTCGQFREDLDRQNDISFNHGFPSFLPVINGEATSIDQLSPVQTQLAMCAVQVALFKLWVTLGVTPSAVIGHSLGEYAALHAAGVLSLSDTLYLVGTRASILESKCALKTHSMLAIRSSAATAKLVLGDDLHGLEVACINGPEDVVLSGTADLVEGADKKLKDKSTILNVPFAFHSSQIESIIEPYADAAKTIQFKKPQIPVISPLLGSVVMEEGVFNANYLTRHAREAVNFAAGLEQAQANSIVDAHNIWIEVGPHPICLGMIRSTLGPKTRGFGSLRKDESPWTTLSRTVSFLYQAGFKVGWSEYHRDFERSQRLLALPCYAFDNKNYWLEYKNNWLLNKSGVSEAAVSGPSGPATTTVQRLISTEKRDDGVMMVFETDVHEKKMHSTIIGHLINGTGLTPASVYADQAMTVADYMRKEHSIAAPSAVMNITLMEILKSITVPPIQPDKPKLVRIEAFADHKKGNITVEYGIYSPQSKTTDIGAKCIVEFNESQTWLASWARSAYLVKKRIDALEQQGGTNRIHRGLAYKLFAGLVAYEPKYQGIRELLMDSQELESTALLELYDRNDAGNFHFSPFWIDSFAHLAGFVLNANDNADLSKSVYISHGWDTMVFATEIDPKKPYRVHVKVQQAGESIMAGDTAIFQGEMMVGFIGNLKFKSIPRPLVDLMLGSPRPSPVVKRPMSTAEPVPAKKGAPKAAPKAAPKKSISSSNQGGPLNKMLEVIAEEVGVPVDELSDEDTFAQLGVDSLLSLTILSKFREGMGLEVPKSLFQDCETVSDLRKQYRGAGNEESGTSEDSSDMGESTPATSEGSSPAPIEESKPVELDDTITKVRSIIAELVGVDVDELIDTDDLTSLGVDSLMNLSITGALREKMGLTIAPDALSSNPSLKVFEETISPSPKAPEKPAPAKKGKPVQPLASSKPKPKPKPKVPLSFLLQGDPKKATKQVMLFPDGSGSATSYDKIPELGPDVCIFGLNSPFLKGAEEYTSTLGGVVARWVEEIRSKQAHGPYIVAGWSAGGYYAYEATKQLTDAGETVEKLILIDSPCRLVYEAFPVNLLDHCAERGLMSTGSKETPQWLVDHFASTIVAVENYMPSPMDAAKAPKTYIIWASDGVLEDFEAEETSLDLNIKVSRFLLGRKKDHGPQGWEQLLPADRIECATVPGTHFTLVQKPNCDTLARLIGDVVVEDDSQRKGKWVHA